MTDALPSFDLKGRTALVTGAARGIGPMDVTDLENSFAAIDRASTEAGPIDILVNNAGGGIADMAINARPDDFDSVIERNVKSAFFLSQRVARHLIEAGRGGNIINVSSQAGLVALPGESVYCLAKAAVSHMTRSLAVEWGKYGIHVNAVCPTFIETPGTRDALSDLDSGRTRSNASPH
ncbi:SDR family NAD(P)-dependent oxidoreductase [Litchfieldella rifensis]|uniref:SDR family NAD(P)-dependent oxidoreductase n=1 Tax=Litchfieldella rifensis TaxID=762643 RepID=A0ABV7LI09_9GAMM